MIDLRQSASKKASLTLGIRYKYCLLNIPLQDLENKTTVEELKQDVFTAGGKSEKQPTCLSLAWSSDGQTLFAGYSDNLIRVWQVSLVQ